MRMVVSGEATCVSYRTGPATRPKPVLIAGEHRPTELRRDHGAAAREVREPEPATSRLRGTANDVESEPRRATGAPSPLAELVAAEAGPFVGHDDRASAVPARLDVHIEAGALGGVREDVLQQCVDGDRNVGGGASDYDVTGRQVRLGPPALILCQHTPEREPLA